MKLDSRKQLQELKPSSSAWLRSSWRAAAAADTDCATLCAGIAQRRATNMRVFAADLRSTDELRDDLTDAQVADIIWSMNADEYWELLVRERAWTPDHFADWLTDAWTRLLPLTP